MRNVLYIEDSVINAKLMDRIFAKHLPGLALIIAADGVSGLRLLESEDPALLLLDCHLPDMSGLELLKSVRSSGSTVPVVAVTADARAELEVELTAAGAECVITKPFVFADLIEHIREFVPDKTAGDLDETARSLAE